MDDADVDTLLQSNGWGVLALADDDEPYSIPISFGYDGEDVYFSFLRTGGASRKSAFIADGKTARLLVTTVRARFDWQSVAVTGTVESIDWNGEDWETLVDLLDGNPWFSSEFEDAEEVEGIRGWRLTPTSVHGVEVRPGRD
jgi:nitroimidazol reductase NimA-like FMN-containing flavoprotein (pyridoxamine 5'-phosphate oxidase superfamily)